MRVEIITATLFLLSFQFSLAQVSNVIPYRKFQYTRFLGIARSSFDVNGRPSSPSYASLEVRIGVGVVKPIGKYFELKSGLNAGLKVKRESYFFGPSKQFTYEPWVMRSLDETASNRNHFFAEIPLTLQYNLPKTRIKLKSGLNFRFWAPNDDSVDVLAGRPEIGMLGGISYHLIKRINIGIEHYYGLTSILKGSYSGNNSKLIEYNVMNQFTQIVIEQTF
jgi:hypothetical protein